MERVGVRYMGRADNLRLSDRVLAFTLVSIAPLLAFLYLTSHPINHDVAWLLEATRRWIGGAELYRDIVEINPPLIFVENLLLTGGLLTKHAYLAGTCIAVGISAVWSGRWHGIGTAVAVAVSLCVVAISDFGQRDHLALIFLIPFLLAPDGLPRREQIAIGVWAFLGVGLKPHFAIIPALFVLAQCISVRSTIPLWRLQNFALGALCLGLVVIVALIWPHFFTELIPLGRAVYPFYTGGLTRIDLVSACLCIAVGILVQNRPLGTAVLAAVLVYFLQGKFWHYQLIPSLGLGAIAALTSKGLVRWLALPLLAASPIIGPNPYPGPPIPTGIGTVLILSDRVSAAYPNVFECGVTNASRYPTFWTLPGAWRTGDKQLFAQTISNLNADLKAWQPEIIYSDTRPGRIGRSFRFRDWADLSNYRFAKQEGRYEVWLRRDLAMSILGGERCTN